MLRVTNCNLQNSRKIKYAGNVQHLTVMLRSEWEEGVCALRLLSF